MLGVSWDGLERSFESLWRPWEGSWGPQRIHGVPKPRNSLIFATPIRRNACFPRPNMVRDLRGELALADHLAELSARRGPLEQSRMVQNGPEWSHGVSLAVLRECMRSPGTVLRGLATVSGGPERVHGVPKLEILSFLQPLWCDLHVFQGPTWDRVRLSIFIWAPIRRTLYRAGGP